MHNKATMLFKKTRENALEIFNKAIKAANPRRCITENVKLKDRTLLINKKEYDLDQFKSIYVISVGKASVQMAMGIEGILRDKITGGIVISNKKGHKLSKLQFYSSSHPIPNEKSLNAADKILQILNKAKENDLVIFLISGGGSALIAKPYQGLSLQDLKKTTEALLRSGVDKYGLNIVRKHISQIKGGGLLEKALPATIINLVLSNVVGDRLDAIASGPSVPDTTSFEDSCRVIEALNVEHRIPPSVLLHLENGRRGNIVETVKKDSFDTNNIQTFIVGNNMNSLISCENKARQFGYNTFILTSQISGESREVAKVVAGIAFDIERFNMPVKKPACLIFGGETYVNLKGTGKGGRNTELALSFSMEIMNHNIVGLFCDTDGIDGPINAAGAICDGNSRIRARELGISAREHLTQNNSYEFFKKLGDLIITGVTGTNVMDIGIVLIN